MASMDLHYVFPGTLCICILFRAAFIFVLIPFLFLFLFFLGPLSHVILRGSFMYYYHSRNKNTSTLNLSDFTQGLWQVLGIDSEYRLAKYPPSVQLI
jgi:hypothetical protein